MEIFGGEDLAAMGVEEYRDGEQAKNDPVECGEERAVVNDGAARSCYACGR